MFFLLLFSHLFSTSASSLIFVFPIFVFISSHFLCFHVHFSSFLHVFSCFFFAFLFIFNEFFIFVFIFHFFAFFFSFTCFPLFSILSFFSFLLHVLLFFFFFGRCRTLLAGSKNRFSTVPNRMVLKVKTPFSAKAFFKARRGHGSMPKPMRFPKVLLPTP